MPERAFGVLAAARLARIGQLRHVPSADLIGMLHAGGYACYDVRTADRLLQLCEVIRDRYDRPAASRASTLRAGPTVITVVPPPGTRPGGLPRNHGEKEDGEGGRHHRHGYGDAVQQPPHREPTR